MKFSTENIFTMAVSGIGLLVSGLLYLSNRRHEQSVKNVCDNLNAAFDDLKDGKVNVDISQELVDKVAEEKIEKEVSYRISAIKSEALRNARADFDDAISREINAQYADTKAEVRRALKEKADRIDISSLRRDVVQEAKAAATEKFKEDLDDVLYKYNNQLDDIGTIYTSIAKKFQEK